MDDSVDESRCVRPYQHVEVDQLLYYIDDALVTARHPNAASLGHSGSS